MTLEDKYDVIVVGAGHAGCEAAHSAATLGSKVLVITQNLETIARMSCNPAMGGVAKGQIIREIDALGGMSGLITDTSSIQFRMLNKSKGPAMWSPRAQCDRKIFEKEWRLTLEKNQNIDFWQDTVENLIIENETVVGLVSKMGVKIFGKSIILCNGTFLNGIIHLGQKNYKGGRAAEPAAEGITKQLIELGFTHGRMKTGTPPRLDGRTIDYSQTEEQFGDEKPVSFSFMNSSSLKKQQSCFIAYTSPEVHNALKEGFDDSPMFTGRISGTGPRYCPSIEDKIERFASKERHQLFIEPEGKETIEIYLNGFSTSLPESVQLKALRKIKGLEKVKMFRAGYAIEYDYFPPTQLKHTLETKIINNLFFCGQINGTTGYEEAAAQGLIAGINAHQKISEKTEFILTRSDAYIGVLIDDLITKGTEEPYRMFTSRAEFRLLLRQDNADIRLTKKGHELGLASNERLSRLKMKEDKTNLLIKFLSKESVDLNKINKILKTKNSKIITQKVKYKKILSRPHINISDLQDIDFVKKFILKESISIDAIEQAEIEIKYGGYLSREKETAKKLVRLENIKIHKDFEFDKLHSISTEGREKLKEIQPTTIGQASRISGVSPSDINILLIYLGR
ncbi:tRNA uridine-5-carboxymethylaminomethyl(34) synthesis enzyme MnmG [Flavobacteriales bacterium]|nr:tRNA uridine-5-carboxymethylaminomethyl(34) synthesis enzyme MnmG [Flavobacteriales bacterium]MDC3257723.1 tRNA uridine-5-carboxymethylaminomethyl(34) synthesis enzyme MnmG [Flavobacteriales bacterium]|tara:strand:- start:2013 stop:3884 length:1872 start_codon:yes stop_codon:yes gene_type:complete